MTKHGADITDSYPIPAPGRWSEEGAEAKNKFEKSRRLHHARKMDVEVNMVDMVNFQCCTSDPVTLKWLELELLSKRPKKEPSERFKSFLLHKDPVEMDVDSVPESQGESEVESENDSENDSEYDSESSYESPIESEPETIDSDSEYEEEVDPDFLP